MSILGRIFGKPKHVHVPETKQPSLGSGKGFPIPFEKIQHLMMVAVASPADEDETRWLFTEFLLQVFKLTNPHPSWNSLVLRLLDQDKLSCVVRKQPRGQSLDPTTLAPEILKTHLNQQLAATCSLVLQAGLVTATFPNGTTANVGLLFVVAYLPSPEEELVVQLAELNRPMEPLR